MQAKHQQVLTSINENFEIVSRLEKGMSNFTYIVKDQLDNKYVYRFPGDGAHNFVNYSEELKVLTAIADQHISSDLVYFNQQSGIKIATYIPGAVIDQDNVNYQQVSKLLSKFHQLEFTDLPNYDHLTRLNFYETLHNNPQALYATLKTQWLEIYETHLKMNVNTPCHGDAQPSNIIIGEDGNYYLMDYEFAALNDPIYDISCFGNNDFKHAENLLKAYYQAPINDHYIRLYGWRAFQCLQWFNVASFKAEIGLSEKLNIDFKQISFYYIEQAQQHLNTLNKYL